MTSQKSCWEKTVKFAHEKCASTYVLRSAFAFVSAEASRVFWMLLLGYSSVRPGEVQDWEWKKDKGSSKNTLFCRNSVVATVGKMASDFEKYLFRTDDEGENACSIHVSERFKIILQSKIAWVSELYTNIVAEEKR